MSALLSFTESKKKVGDLLKASAGVYIQKRARKIQLQINLYMAQHLRSFTANTKPERTILPLLDNE
jgi:hypothetical protein